MDQPSNIISYPELQPVTPPVKKHRKLKIAIYLALLTIIGYFIYTHFSKPTTDLTTPSATATNKTTPSTAPTEPAGYWDKSKITLPSYPTINSSTDLHQAATSIEIPDFADQFDNLKNLINK